MLFVEDFPPTPPPPWCLSKLDYWRSIETVSKPNIGRKLKVHNNFITSYIFLFWYLYWQFDKNIFSLNFHHQSHHIFKDATKVFKLKDKKWWIFFVSQRKKGTKIIGKKAEGNQYLKEKLTGYEKNVSKKENGWPIDECVYWWCKTGNCSIFHK